jgi:hypothetical protein
MRHQMLYPVKPCNPADLPTDLVLSWRYGYGSADSLIDWGGGGQRSKSAGGCVTGRVTENFGSKGNRLS